VASGSPGHGRILLAPRGRRIPETPGGRESVPTLGRLTGVVGRRRRAVFELVLTVAVAVGLALAVQAWAVKPYKIPSSSMEPTLTEGQRVLVDRLFFSPHVGQIVVFHPPVGAENEQCGRSHPQTAACDWPNRAESSETYIKRIVAGPGDVISIRDGHVIRNGIPEADSYIRPCGAGQAECSFTTPIRIPRGMWFMMGDNRGESDDSRFWGPVPSNWLIGNAFFTYWPPDRVGSL
jgi:signal peptidase I